MSKPRIAIIGSGVSGLGAAYALKDTADIELWEARDRLGGHANTVDIDYDGSRIAVDTGFIVFNTLRYPNLVGLFEALDVPSFRTNMSFGFCGDGLEWSSEKGGVFAQPQNLLRPSFLRMLREIYRFNAQAKADLATGLDRDVSLQSYLDQHGFREDFRRRYLLPMGAAIWSTSCEGMNGQPAATVLKFFDNHRLLQVRRPKLTPWRTVKGGSRAYVDAVGRELGDRVRTSRRVIGVSRVPGGVMLRSDDGDVARFDQVILACHSDQALLMLEDPSAEERALLGAIRYDANHAVLHRDTRVMPKTKKAWAAWVYRTRPGAERTEVTYDMNRLQGIDADKPLFVTLNPASDIDPACVFGRYQYDHPQFDATAIAAQRVFNSIQGARRTWFAGAWLGYGFHEDGLTSGLRVALRLGGRVPWTFVDGDVDGGPWAAPAREDVVLPQIGRPTREPVAAVS